MRSNLISVKAMDGHYKHPRLYVDQPLGAGKTAILGEAQAHYLKHVLRRNAGDSVRLFNPRDGEWLASLSGIEKKTVTAQCDQMLRAPQSGGRHIHLIFPPLAKDRLDFLVEKAVELGVSDFHPITAERSDIRKINAERIAAQIIEAAEQCERHDIPTLHPLQALDDLLAGWDDALPIYAGLERTQAPSLHAAKGSCALLIGPPGGFSDEEKSMLGALPFIHPVTLTKNILRSETAALFGLSLLAE